MTKIYLYIFCFSAKSSVFLSSFGLLSCHIAVDHLIKTAQARDHLTLTYVGQLARFSSRAFLVQETISGFWSSNAVYYVTILPLQM